MKQRLTSFATWAADVFLRAPTDALDVFLAILTWSWGAWFLSPPGVVVAPPDLAGIPLFLRFRADQVLIGLVLVALAVWIVVAAYARRPGWRAGAMLATSWFWGGLLVAVAGDGLRPAAVVTYAVVAAAALWSWSRHAGIFAARLRPRGG